MSVEDFFFFFLVASEIDEPLPPGLRRFFITALQPQGCTKQFYGVQAGRPSLGSRERKLSQAFSPGPVFHRASWCIATVPWR